MNVYVFPEGDPLEPNNFVGPIRLLDPLKALARNYALSFVCHSPGSEPALAGADLAIVQRACFRSKRELDNGLELLTRAQGAGTRIAYEIDDHLFCPNLPELIADSLIDELDEEAYLLTQAHREVLAIADYVMCPTEALGQALQKLGSGAKSYVVPTALDFHHHRWERRPSSHVEARSHISIGWSGGSRVGRDLEMLLPVLLRIVQLHADVTLMIGGSVKYASIFSSIPSDRLRVLQWVPYDQYPGLLSAFDLALVPMQDHAYNRCKSPLKVIDYAAVGVPAICSPVEPFTRMNSLGCSPTLANGDDEWTNLINQFIEMKRHGNLPSRELAAQTRERHGLKGEALARYWSVFCEMTGTSSGEATC